MDYEAIIRKHTAGNEALRAVLTEHSRQVAQKAVGIAEANPHLGADKDFILEAAMLHDIGIVRCNAPSIHCFGTEPYIRHGVAGEEILEAEGLPAHARVCSRHTGAGITRADVERQGLPLPPRDYLPETVEEKIICYADKFFSKARPGVEKTFGQACRSMAKFGGETLGRFISLAEELGQDTQQTHDMKTISTDKAPKAVGPYSQAADMGAVVFCSGQLPIDPATGKFAEGGIREQTRQSLSNARSVLEAAGLGLANVVKTTVYLADMADFAAMNEVYAQFFSEPFPARSAVAVKALPMGAMVEVECIAAR